MTLSTLSSNINPFAYLNTQQIPEEIEDEQLSQSLPAKKESKNKEPYEPLLEKYDTLSELNWFCEGKWVKIIRSGEELNYLVIDNITGKELKKGYIDKDGNTADKIIDLLMNNRVPEIKENGSVNFQVFHSSKLDYNVPITENLWAITIANTRLSCRPPKERTRCVNTDHTPSLQDWAGHAVLIIEMVKNGKYIMERAHLVTGKTACIGKVEKDEITNFKYLERISQKTETWQRRAAKIQKILDDIERELAIQRTGKIAVLFSHMGGETIFSDLAKLGDRIVDNCYTWDRKKLLLGGIELFGDRSRIVNTPRLNIEQKSLASKAAVYVAINFLNEEIRIPNPLNITECIYKKLKKEKVNSWQVLSSLPDGRCEINGRIFNNVVAKVNVKFRENRGFFYNTGFINVEKIEILIKIRNRKHYGFVTNEDIRDCILKEWKK